MSDHTAKQNVARLSIFSNAFLTIAKLIVGLSIGSVSIISEAIHSGMDLFASFIAYFSVRKSAMPPDVDHAFGHGKYEDASGLIEAMLIILAAAIIIWEAVNKLIHGGDTLSSDLLFIGMIVMAVSACLNFFVSQKLMKVAKATDSIALESDAWHLRTDVFTSAGVVVGLILIKITGLTFLDSVIAILVALLILREAVSSSDAHSVISWMKASMKKKWRRSARSSADIRMNIPTTTVSKREKPDPTNSSSSI